MKTQLAEEDVPIYQGPVASGEIPFFISPTFLNDIASTGVVGGAKQPLQFSVSCERGLILVSWEKSDDETVREYDIEYDAMEWTSEIGPESVIKANPISVRCKGTVLRQWVDKLMPGKKYSFRIRALNMAGWGIWSKPIVCHYPPPPITVEYTREIVEVVVPASGLYCITAQGAKAADGEMRKGGCGAIIEAKFLLNV